MKLLIDTGILIRKRSTIHGQGVFTTAAIPRGAAVMSFGGQEVPFAQVPPEARALQVGPDAWIVEDVEADYLENYVNHRCTPNLGFAEGTLTLYALRDIADGEELFWDYSTAINDPTWRVTCRCGDANCRGAIVGYGALDAAARARLRPIALGYLR
jgi:SET domain-containing protein